ncbi:MAG TPA: sialate O-acetylesterase [Pyrinomonadaceae bacterium]|nr:sialate O-acetylesterase [Pyrinomonadaceae bacterium]
MTTITSVFSDILKLTLTVLAVVVVARAEVHLPSIIGDNMVLQQGVKVRIWGKANAGERVTVSFEKKSAGTVADAQGRWQVWLGPLKAGGPSELTIKGDNVVTINNVLVGEVWICSGQSNMEWPLVNTVNGQEAVAQANYPEIRLFTVEHTTSVSPADDLKGHWVVTTPEEAGSFSAVGYFFGREIYQHVKAPVGLINTSWGGTPAEAWTAVEALRSSPELKPILDRYENSLNALPQTKAAYERALAEWEEKNLYVDGENKGEALGYADVATSTADWARMDLPKQFEAAGLLIDGVVWFRKAVELPASWAGKDLVLNLTAIDDYDVTYFNGKKIGSTGRETANSYMIPRKYMVPGSLVHAGSNVIAVRVFDRAGEGGFGRGGEMSLRLTGADRISLRGNWDYKVERALEPKHPDWGTRPEPVGASNQNSPGVLYNAMLAPLVPFAIRGAIWYQGESNAGRAYQYRTLFPTMIRNWRSAWGYDFPFYFVQLPNWRARQESPSESDWAELREAQTFALRESKTGMAVAIDVGDGDDLHPRNKLEIGRRLAILALANVYGQAIVPSGPLFDRFKVEGNEVRISFKYAEGLKTSDGGPVKGFAIAGADRKFVWADARIEGDTVVVSSPAIVKPEAVRYAWADNPLVNLYNKADLPASPFRTDDWPGVTATRR